MNSSYPYVWINAVTNDPEASVEVEDATEYLGGYFKRLDSKKNILISRRYRRMVLQSRQREFMWTGH